MTFDELKQALTDHYDPGTKTFSLPAAALGSIDISDLIIQVLEEGEITITATDGPAVADLNVTVVGTASLYEFQQVAVEARFYLTGGATGTAEMALRLLLPTAWTFPQTYPILANSVFAGLTFAAQPAKSFLFASQAFVDPLSSLNISQGLNFYGAIEPSGSVFGPITAILGSFLQATTAGPIVPGPGGPNIQLAVNYNATLQKYFPQLEIPVDLDLISIIDATGKYGTIGLRFSATFSLGGPTVTLSTLLTGKKVTVLNVEGRFDGLTIPSPSELLKLIGGSGEVTNTLPDEYQKAGAVTIKMIRFGIEVLTPGITSVELVVGALEGDGWELVPKWFTLRDFGAIFIISDPFGANRNFTTTIWGDINVPTKDPILQLEASATYADHFTIGAALVEGTTFDFVKFIGLFLPGTEGAPSLIFTELGLSVEFAQPKTLYTFVAALTSDWVFRLGGTSILAVQFAEFRLDNYSNNGEMGGEFRGMIQILGADMNFAYIMPGEFSVDAHIPEFFVDLQKIASDLAGGWDAPSWFPSFTFPETNISLARRIDTGEATYSFHLDASPSVGVISLDVLRYNGTWGFAAGIKIKGGKISSFPGLGGLSSFDDFLELKDLVMTIATQEMPTYQLRAPRVPHPRYMRSPQALRGTHSLRRRNVYLPADSLGAKAGLYIRGGLILKDTGDQHTLRKFLGIDLGFELDLSLYLGLNPAQNSELAVAFKLAIDDTLDLTCTFGAAINNGIFKLYLKGSIAVTLQGHPLLFQVEMSFVPNGAYLAGSMIGTIEFWVIKLSNLAVVIGISLEGIPSFGIAATIDVSKFNSSIAAFFDANVPSRSMLAGAVSDITLQDVVDELVGLIQEPMTAELQGVLDSIGIHGTRKFDLPGTLGTALDNLDIKAVSVAFAAVGITIPASIENVLLTVNAANQVWFLTDLTTMIHYQLKRKDANTIEGSLEAQLYLVPDPAGVDIGGIKFPEGYRIHGVIEFLILRAELNIDIATNKGVAADVLIDPIVIFDKNLLSITGFNGQGGPQLSLSTYTQPNHPNPDFRPPHFFVTGDFNLLGIEVAAIYVNISQAGFAFDVKGEYFTGTKFELKGHFKSLDDLAVSGSAFIGIDRSADLGPLGKITIQAGVAGEVGVSYDGTTPSAYFTGGFKFAGYDFSIPKLSLDVNTAALGQLAETVYNKVVDLLKKFLLEDAERWLDWIKNGIIQGVKDIDKVLTDIFGWLTGGIWGDDGRVITTIREVLKKTEAGSIQVDWKITPPPDLDKAVRAWADTMLEQAVTASVELARQKLTPGNADQFNLSMVQSFVYEYRQTQAIPWAIRPQSALPSITSLGYNFNDFYQLVDQREFRVSVQVNVDFAVVFDVIVTIHYPTLGAGVKSFQFTSPEQSHLFVSQWSDEDEGSYEIEYTVNFREPGQPSFYSGRLDKSVSSIVLNPESIGIRRVLFDGSNVDWNSQVTRVEVAFFYLNSPGETPLEVNFELNKSKQIETVESQFKLPVTASYTYTVTYFTADGNTYTVPSIVSNAERQFINNPFQPYIVSVISAGIVEGKQDVNMITLKVTYDAGKVLGAVKNVVLNKDAPWVDLDLEVLSGSNQLLRYQGTVIYKTGPPVQITPTATTNPSILVGDVPPWFDVEIDPSLIPWSKGVLQVNLDIFNENDKGPIQRGAFIFRPNTAPQHWGFFQTAEIKNYFWFATYYYSDLTSQTTKKQIGTSPILTLPVKPD